MTAAPRQPGRARAAALVAALLTSGASAQVFRNEPEALRSAFPDADAFAPRDVLLSAEMSRRLEQLARARVEDRMITFYTARKQGKLVGYAVIHSHVVRTKRETLCVSFEPDGRIRKVEVIAFLEPSEYLPPERWLEQFAGKGHSDRLAVGDDVAPITGATLSARGIAERSRWLLQALLATVAASAAPARSPGETPSAPGERAR
jgi:hypothetical protein